MLACWPSPWAAIAQLHDCDSEYSRLSICVPPTSAPPPSPPTPLHCQIRTHLLLGSLSSSHTPSPSSTELPDRCHWAFPPQPPLCHHPILNNLTLHPALFGTWTPRQAGRLLSFSSLCPILDILDTASIPAVLTRPTGRHDSEARLRASGGDVTPAHHQGGTHYQLRIPKRL